MFLSYTQIYHKTNILFYHLRHGLCWKPNYFFSSYQIFFFSNIRVQSTQNQKINDGDDDGLDVEDAGLLVDVGDLLVADLDPGEEEGGRLCIGANSGAEQDEGELAGHGPLDLPDAKGGADDPDVLEKECIGRLSKRN